MALPQSNIDREIHRNSSIAWEGLSNYFRIVRECSRQERARTPSCKLFLPHVSRKLRILKYGRPIWTMRYQNVAKDLSYTSKNEQK